MANHKSALKRIKQNEKRYERNKAYRTKMKTIVKAVVGAKSKEEANKAFKIANKELHKMVSKGILKKQTAARKVSRLFKFISKLQ